MVEEDEVKLWCFETVSSSMVIIKQFPKSSHTMGDYVCVWCTKECIATKCCTGI